MTPPTGTAAWTSRPVPQAMTAEKLAALVDRSVQAADELLFTTTPGRSSTRSAGGVRPRLRG